MIAYKAYKFRIYPTDDQKVLLAKTFGSVRLVFNHYLGRRKEQYEADQTTLSYKECFADLPLLKKELPFLREVDSIALQQSLRHLMVAYDKFFKGKAHFPRFKSKHKNQRSYTTMWTRNNIRLCDGVLTLPKLGGIKIRVHRSVPSDGAVTSVTVSQTPTGKYYTSILYACETKDVISVDPVRASQNAVGLDYSSPEIYVPSDGISPAYPKYYRRTQDQLARAQRILSHRVKGSNRYEKQRLKVAILHETIANQRMDFLHKLSRQITNAYDVVCIEDLDMKAMSQPTDTLKLGKATADNGWGLFTTFLGYKLKAMGKHLVTIDKWFPSSRTCHVCGYVYADLQLNERRWACDSCRTTHDRDLNASINIKTKGLEMLLST